MTGEPAKMATAIDIICGALDGMNREQLLYALNIAANLYGLKIEIIKPEPPKTESSP